MFNAYAVVGANFGDEGKGLVTDWLASQKRKPLVVLHNGGPQRAHTVTTLDGKEHIFRHIGAGTFAGADTFIARQFVCNPIVFREEYVKLLPKLKEAPRVFVDARCKFTTFFDMLINQAREIERGVAKHGSCGLGVFETMCRYQDGSIKFKEQTINLYGISFGDFAKLNYLDKFNYLESLRKYYTEKRIDQTNLHKMPAELEAALNSNIAIDNFIRDFDFMAKRCKIVYDLQLLNEYTDVIFENGQGLLLDQENLEYYPHLTPSHTGLYNVNEILEECGYTGFIEAFYVTRTYMTRHGVGRFDTECDKADINPLMWDKTNVPNLFQDNLRYGKMDIISLFKRISKENKKSKFRVLSELVVTHVNEYDINIPVNTVFLKEFYSNGYTRESLKNSIFDFKVNF